MGNVATGLECDVDGLARGAGSAYLDARAIGDDI